MSLDRDAARALAAVDERPQSQLAALAALQALIDDADDDGVIKAELRRLLDERRASFRRFHLDRAARAADLVTLRGDAARADALRIVRDAVAVVAHIDGDSGELRTLRMRLEDLERGGAGNALPFFARYLVPQRR